MTNWLGGKGSKQRPTDHAKYSENWDRIFGKKEPEITETIIRVPSDRTGGLCEGCIYTSDDEGCMSALDCVVIDTETDSYKYFIFIKQQEKQNG